MRFFEAQTHSGVNQFVIGAVLAAAVLAIVLSVVLTPASGPKIVTLQALKPAVTPAESTSVETVTPSSESTALETITPATPEFTSQSTIRELPVQEAKPLEAAIPSALEPSTATAPATRASTLAVAPKAPTATELPVRDTNQIETRKPRPAVASRAPVTTRSSLPLRRNPRNVSVQAGAFKSQENAQKLANRLLSAGVKARLESADGLYRVIVGPYKDEVTAKAAARGIVTLMR